jgi:nucleotide-binding universal stress UspA family protein
MTTPTARLRHYRIVVGVDLSEYSDLVIERALDQAARHERPELHFLTVKEMRKLSSEDAHRRLAALVYPALEAFNRYATGWRVRLHVRTGKPAAQIAGLAADVRADLIVIGAFGLHAGGRTLRTVASRVLQDAICPTLVAVMPNAQDTSPHCGFCDAIREDTDGERLFCDEHAGDRLSVTAPTTTWSGGVMMW